MWSNASGVLPCDKQTPKALLHNNRHLFLSSCICSSDRGWAQVCSMWKGRGYSGHVLSILDAPEPSWWVQKLVSPPSCHVLKWTCPPYWPKQVSRQVQHPQGRASHSGQVEDEEMSICWMITPTIIDQYAFKFWLTWPASPSSHITSLEPREEKSLTLNHHSPSCIVSHGEHPP